MSANAWYRFREELEAKHKWELEHIVAKALDQLPAEEALVPRMALHLLMERADNHSKRAAS